MPRAGSATGLDAAGASDDISNATVELDRIASGRERHGLGAAGPGPAGKLSDADDHRGGAVPGRRPHRRAGAPGRRPATGQDRPSGGDREPHRRLRHHRFDLRRARAGGRLHALRQFSRRCAEPALHAADLQSGRRFRDARLDCRRAADDPGHRRQAAVQDGGRTDCRRQGQSQQVQLRHVRSGFVAESDARAVQRHGRNSDHCGALSRLGRGRHRRCHQRHPGRVHVLLPGQDAGRQRQASCARDRRPEADGGLARCSDPS